MILYAAFRPRDDSTAEPHEWTVEAPTYEQAIKQAKASVPDGWALLHVRHDTGA